MNMKRLLFLSYLWLILGQVQAQVVMGKLVDNNEKPLPYVNIVLQTIDSTFVSGTTSDIKGAFSLEAPRSENYLIRFSSIGYQSQIIRINDLTQKKNLGTIMLSETSELLDEVNVTASSTVKRVDRQIVFPSEQQLKQSASGYDLLSKLMLSDLQVNPIQNKISTIEGGNVETRINDIKATNAQISSLRPTDVIRIEYIDNPGIRYADTNVKAVVNYIVKRQTSGINGGIQGMNAATTGFGNDNVYLKANIGRSEFGLDYYLSYRDYDDRYGEGFDHFEMPDGTTHNRTLEAIATPFGYTSQVLEASYNLSDPKNKYTFNVLFTNEMFSTEKQDHSQRIVEERKNGLTFFRHVEDKNNTPSLDIYYNYSLPNRQKITANLVGTYIDTDYLYDYKEYEKPEDVLSHYAYSTDGKHYSLIGEAIYNKEWDKVVLSAGVKGNTAYTKNVYTGNSEKELHMHNSSLYGYIQAQGRWQKLNYVLGLGLMRQAFSESDIDFTYTTLRPTLSLSYPVLKNTMLRYSFSMSPTTPSLSQLSDVVQQNNNLEITRGNRNLNPYRSYFNQLTLSWSSKRFSAQVTGNHYYYHKPIMTSITPIQKEDGTYLLEYASINGKSHRNAGVRLNVVWKIIPDFLTISASGGVKWYRSKGNDFANEYTNWTGGVKISANYKRFSLLAYAYTRPITLYGYYLNYGEKDSGAQLNYTIHKNMTIGAACLYPFTPSGWTGGKRIIGNPYVEKKDWTHIEDNGNMFCFYFNWKFSSGRKYQSNRKTMNNKDSDSGVVK